MHQIISHVFGRDFAPEICHCFPHETNFLPISPILQYYQFTKETAVYYPLQLYTVCSNFFCRLIVLLLFSSTWPDFAKNAREYILVTKYFVYDCVPRNPIPIHSKEAGGADFIKRHCKFLINLKKTGYLPNMMIERWYRREPNVTGIW